MTLEQPEDTSFAAIIHYVRETHHLIIEPRTAQRLQEETESETTNCEIKGRDVGSGLARSVEVNLTALSDALAGVAMNSYIGRTSTWSRLLEKVASDPSQNSQDAAVTALYEQVRRDVENQSAGTKQWLLRVADMYWEKSTMRYQNGFDPEAFQVKVREDMGVDSRALGKKNSEKLQGEENGD